MSCSRCLLQTLLAHIAPVVHKSIPSELCCIARHVIEIVGSSGNRDDTVAEASKGIFESTTSLERALTLRSRATCELLARLASEADRITTTDYSQLCVILRHIVLPINLVM